MNVIPKNTLNMCNLQTRIPISITTASIQIISNSLKEIYNIQKEKKQCTKVIEKYTQVLVSSE